MGRGGYLGGSTIIGPRSVGWFGSGSPTSRSKKPGQKLKLRSAKPKKKKRKGAKANNPARAVPVKGNGLTIPEQVAKAKKRVRSVEADLARTRQHLIKLERQLVEARKQLERAENLPRRSALGQALASALNAKKLT